MLKYLFKKYRKLRFVHYKIIQNFKLNHRYKFKIIYFIYNISSLRFIYEKINPPMQPSNKPPSTFFIGVLTFYIALWGLSTQIYESKNSIIQSRYSTSLNSLISNPNNKDYSLLLTAQSMECPIKPEIFKPLTPVKSILGYMSIDPDINNEIKKFIEINKTCLDNANLYDANLYEANLYEANLENSDLGFTDLENADIGAANLKNAKMYSSNLKNTLLFESNLENADLSFADLENADLYEANLENANLEFADLEIANLGDANLLGANLLGANLCRTILTNVKNLTIGQLSIAYTLYDAKLDPKLLKEIKDKYPKLLERPKIKFKQLKNPMKYMLKTRNHSILVDSIY